MSIKHESSATHRLKSKTLSGMRERSFARLWESENNPPVYLNSGIGVLAHLVPDMTQRDATVAATVIQWLGTNCGQAFLREVERDINGEPGIPLGREARAFYADGKRVLARIKLSEQFKALREAEQRVSIAEYEDREDSRLDMVRRATTTAMLAEYQPEYVLMGLEDGQGLGLTGVFALLDGNGEQVGTVELLDGQIVNEESSAEERLAQ